MNPMVIIAGRTLSQWELLHSGGARWWWDPSYITEAEREREQGPLPEEIARDIDECLLARAQAFFSSRQEERSA